MKLPAEQLKHFITSPSCINFKLTGSTFIHFHTKSLPPTFTERKCRSEDSYNYNYELNRTETNEFKATAYCLKQSKKGYIGNLTKCINCAINLPEIPCNMTEVALMNEKLEFAVFKLERITDQYSQCHLRRTSCCSPPLHRI